MTKVKLIGGSAHGEEVEVEEPLPGVIHWPIEAVGTPEPYPENDRIAYKLHHVAPIMADPGVGTPVYIVEGMDPKEAIALIAGDAV